MKSPFIWKYVIARCRGPGVHAGVLVDYENQEAILRDSRRLWYWKPAKKKWLSGVAVFGLAKDSKIGTLVQDIHLMEVVELIPCSEEAEKSIRNIEDD